MLCCKSCLRSVACLFCSFISCASLHVVRMCMHGPLQLACSAHWQLHFAHGQVPASSTQSFHTLELLLNPDTSSQHGLKGNRAVSGSVWSVVTAATRAFPIQLSPSVEKAQTVADACAGVDLVQAWVLQAVADGSLVTLVQRLRSQPQIITAYARDALVRDASAADRLVAQLQQLKELMPVTPYDKYLLQQQQPAHSTDRPATPVHIQTEVDLQPHSNHHQQHAGVTQQQRQQQQQQQQERPTPVPGKQGGGLVGRLSTQRLPLGSFGRSKSAKASSSSSSSSTHADASRSQAAAGCQQDCLGGADLQELVKVQLLVPTAPDQAGPDAEQLVQVLLRWRHKGMVSQQYSARQVPAAAAAVAAAASCWVLAQMQ
ncbi:hypothetical protein COO60DRAFT_1189330 [Scenedesmus sp. NREL 46B-D3]|nr:hypothetical protein COO60DRAFT_1189330 [Scenedesmus sp. NREL 46B-D3]